MADSTYKAHELHPDELTEILIENDSLRYANQEQGISKRQFIAECKHRGINSNIPIERKLIEKMINKYKFK